MVGLLFAAFSVYWALGGMWLLSTVGRSFEEHGRAGDVGWVLLGWVAAALKVAAAVLPVLALRRLTRAGWDRVVWVLAWLAAAALSSYGLVTTTVSLLVQFGAIQVSAGANHRAQAWHAFLWDPWFLVWGILVVAALVRGRDRRATL
ncbi:MAG: DUF3995 domain-containing protein [Acidimicrobiales bacterium]